jgi:mono/diheme cytochrome c family protein
VPNRRCLAAVALFVISLAWAAAPSADRQALPSPAAPQIASTRATLDQYCVACHNSRVSNGGLALDSVDLSRLGDHGDLWEKVVRKLQTRTMPPVGAPRPDEPTYQHLIDTLTSGLDRVATARPDAGRPMLRRMNRSEYANAIRDLLALDVDAATLLPPDDSAYGFDNIADVLGVSPSLQERYLSAASRISALAVGDTSRAPVAETYRVRQDLSQNLHLEGLPLGTVGGMMVEHTFPLDGEYEFRVRLQTTNFGNLRGLDYPHEVETSVDGERIHTATIGGHADLAMMFEHPQNAGEAIEGRLTSRVRVNAGRRPVAVAFVRFLPIGDSRRLQQFLRSSVDTLDWTGLPHIQSVTISGPFGPTGAGDTPSRRRIFTCRPSGDVTTTAGATEESRCARRIIGTLARRAYRHPVADDDLRPLMEFYQDGRREGGFETGIQRALEAILASPRFMFRVERDPDGVPPGRIYAIGDIELASRLSFFLWSSIPDAALMDAAESGTLRTPAVLERQVRRMLADLKADALVANFAGQWLQLRNVRSILPNSDEFPDFDDSLRQSMLRETELLFASMMQEDRPVLDLLNADYTFVNERLARHYGIPDIYGSRFTRVAVSNPARRGLLGHASILALTSHAERTSPVVRGKWVLDNLLGTPPPPPPPDVPSLPENPSGQKPKTMRERMVQHRADPACAGCHRIMDPIGLALENFDAVGAWRVTDAGQSIDASAALPDGTSVDGVAELRAALVKRPDVFVTTMAEKLLTYAVGRGLTHRDMPAIRAIVRASRERQYRFSSLVLGIVNSQPFRMRMTAMSSAAGAGPSNVSGKPVAAFSGLNQDSGGTTHRGAEALRELVQPSASAPRCVGAFIRRVNPVSAESPCM